MRGVVSAGGRREGWEGGVGGWKGDGDKRLVETTDQLPDKGSTHAVGEVEKENRNGQRVIIPCCACQFYNPHEECRVSSMCKRLHSAITFSYGQ